MSIEGHVQSNRSYRGDSQQSALINVHGQQGLGRGCGEPEIVEAAEKADLAVALRKPGSGALYGSEDIYDIVVRDEHNGHLSQSTADYLRQLRTEETDADIWRVGGMYGHECVANVVESGVDATMDSNITVDQSPQNYVLSDKLDGAYAGHIRSYLSKFRNPEKAAQYLSLDGKRAAEVIDVLEGASSLTRGDDVETGIRIGFDAGISESRPFVRL
jgi:hypothetical protein|nr:MAG: hypothetical protein J07AB56_04140 [Candidatus Nanosalinarum sp. J07AB56]